MAHWNWQDFWCNICEFSGVLMWPTEMCAILGAILMNHVRYVSVVLPQWCSHSRCFSKKLNYDVIKIAKTMRVLMEIEHIKNQVVQFF